MEDADKHRNKRQQVDKTAMYEDMQRRESILPTNHERNESVKQEEKATPRLAEVQSVDGLSEMTLEQLEQDMGDADILCTSNNALCTDHLSSFSSCIKT